MAAALVLPISGAYTAIWNTFSLGTQNDDGYVLMGNFTGQEVNQSDAYGMTLVEAIWRGLNWRLRFRGLEWNRRGILASMQAFGSSADASTSFTPILANIGHRYSKFSRILVLTAIIRTNPPTFPTTLTALSAITAPNSNVEYLMTSKVREAPFEMVLLPYVATSGGGSGGVTSGGNSAFTTSFTTTPTTGKAPLEIPRVGTGVASPNDGSIGIAY